MGVFTECQNAERQIIKIVEHAAVLKSHGTIENFVENCKNSLKTVKIR
jgi:hypothetical protein